MIDELYNQAILAAAAYGSWDQAENSVSAELKGRRGLTDNQVEYFFFNNSPEYEIYGGSNNGHIDLPNGFSATVFENKKTGDLTVAFRGTDTYELGVPYLTDVYADVLVMLGFSSIADLLDHGQPNSISNFFQSSGLVDASGNSLVGGKDVNFVGHSLGGHLAILAAYRYPDMVDSVETFNGAGLSAFDQIWSAMSDLMTSNGLDESKVNNYYADKGIEVTAWDSPLFSRPGERDPIFIESAPSLGGPVENHSIERIVKSLSVYRVLSILDPSLNDSDGMNVIYDILDGGTNEAEMTLEIVVAQIGGFLGGSLADLEN